jgi:hypothetical protein
MFTSGMHPRNRSSRMITSVSCQSQNRGHQPSSPRKVPVRGLPPSVRVLPEVKAAKEARFLPARNRVETRPDPVLMTGLSRKLEHKIGQVEPIASSSKAVEIPVRTHLNGMSSICMVLSAERNSAPRAASLGAEHRSGEHHSQMTGDDIRLPHLASSRHRAFGKAP